MLREKKVRKIELACLDLGLRLILKICTVNGLPLVLASLSASAMRTRSIARFI